MGPSVAPSNRAMILDSSAGSSTQEQESSYDESNDDNQKNEAVDGFAGDLDFSFHGTSLRYGGRDRNKKSAPEKSGALQGTSALPLGQHFTSRAYFMRVSDSVKD